MLCQLKRHQEYTSSRENAQRQEIQKPITRLLSLAYSIRIPHLSSFDTVDYPSLPSDRLHSQVDSRTLKAVKSPLDLLPAKKEKKKAS